MALSAFSPEPWSLPDAPTSPGARRAPKRGGPPRWVWLFAALVAIFVGTHLIGFGDGARFPPASGGTETIVSADTVHTFTSDGTFYSGNLESVEVLVVGGGGAGGGGGSGARGGGGGGAGEYTYVASHPVTPGTYYSIVVGPGATAVVGEGPSGTDSTALGLTARGGGGGGYAANSSAANGNAGGSGGGAGNSSSGRSGGTATAVAPGVGRNGGSMTASGGGGGGAGGGGAGAVGASHGGASSGGASGGAGTANSISGSSVTYCRGGNGGSNSGGAGATGATPGSAGYGGGGGGAVRGGHGADGIVIIRHATDAS